MSRHANGGGRVLEEAVVSEAVYFDHDSTAKGNALVTGGKFYGTLITGESHISGSPLCEDSEISAKHVSGFPVIKGCKLMDGVRVFDSPILNNVGLHGTIQIFGDAVLDGFTLSYVAEKSGDRLRIHRGRWMRPPRHIEVDGYTISECTDGCFHVGCRCRPLSFWMEKGEKFGRRLGISEQGRTRMRAAFQDWSKG